MDIIALKIINTYLFTAWFVKVRFIWHYISKHGRINA